MFELQVAKAHEGIDLQTKGIVVRDTAERGIGIQDWHLHLGVDQTSG